MKLINYNRDSLLIAFAFFVIYILTMTEIYALSHDSTYYINDIVHFGWYYNPHHILFQPLAKIFSNFLGIFTNWDISKKIGIMNCLSSSFTIYLVHSSLISRLNFSKLKAFFAISCIGFSWAFWYYSGCVEVYQIPLPFIILFALAMSDYNPKTKSIIPLVLFAGFATVFHQSNFLLWFVLIAYLAIKFKKESFKPILNFSLLYIPFIALPYLLVMYFYFGFRTVGECISWMTLYAHAVPEHWAKGGFSFIIKDMVGFGRTFITSYYAFTIPQLSVYIQKAFPDKWFYDEIYLVRNLSPFVTKTLFVFSFAFAGVLIFQIASAIKLIKSRFKSHQNALVPLLSIALMFTLFFSFWASTNLEFWIPQNLIFWIAFFVLFVPEKLEVSNKIVLSYLAFVLFLVNFVAGTNLSRSKENDYYYAKVMKMKNVYDSNTYIFTVNRLILMDYISRYQMYNMVSLSQEKQSEKHIKSHMTLSDYIFARIEYKINQGKKVLLTSDFFEIEENKYDKETLETLDILRTKIKSKYHVKQQGEDFSKFYILEKLSKYKSLN